MAKSENISIKSLIQKKQLDDLNKSAAEQTILLKSIETRMMSTESATGNIETTEEKSLRVSVEALEESKRQAKDEKDIRTREAVARVKESMLNSSILTQMALDTKTYKGVFEKLGDKKDSFLKKFDGLSNTLNTLGILKKGTGGFWDNKLQRARDKKEFVNAQRARNKDTDYVKSDKELGNDYELQQAKAKEIAKNEARLKIARGSLKESDWFKTSDGKKDLERRNTLASEFSRFDAGTRGIPTVVPQVDDSGPTESSPTGMPSIVPTESSPTGIPTVVPTESSPTGMPSIVPTESHEDKTERQLQESKTQDILEKIEVNTRPEVVLTNPKEAGESDGSGGLLGGLLGGIGLLTMMKSLKNLIGGIFESIGTALMGAFRLLFNPGAILKGILKGFAITALVVAIGKGIYDGFIEWQKTGDIGKAIVEGLGSMVEFLTFGLISKEKYKEYAKWFNGKVDEYIITPITNFISHVCDLFDEWIATPIKNAFASIGKFFSETMDSFMSLIQGIGIPEIDISSVSKYIPGAPDKLGPWYPFADSATKESPKPVPKGANNVTPEATPTTSGTKYIPYNRDNANIVHQKSEENIGRKEDMNAKGAGSTIVSAPSSTINNQTVNKNITRLPPTNQHGPYVKINQVGW